MVDTVAHRLQVPHWAGNAGHVRFWEVGARQVGCSIPMRRPISILHAIHHAIHHAIPEVDHFATTQRFRNFVSNVEVFWQDRRATLLLPIRQLCYVAAVPCQSIRPPMRCRLNPIGRHGDDCTLWPLVRVSGGRRHCDQ